MPTLIKKECTSKYRGIHRHYKTEKKKNSMDELWEAVKANDAQKVEELYAELLIKEKDRPEDYPFLLPIAKQAFMVACVFNHLSVAKLLLNLIGEDECLTDNHIPDEEEHKPIFVNLKYYLSRMIDAKGDPTDTLPYLLSFSKTVDDVEDLLHSAIHFGKIVLLDIVLHYLNQQ